MVQIHWQQLGDITINQIESKVVGGYRDRPTGSVSGYALSSSGWQGGKRYSSMLIKV